VENCQETVLIGGVLSHFESTICQNGSGLKPFGTQEGKNYFGKHFG
jgi:hypothetical protein